MFQVACTSGRTRSIGAGGTEGSTSGPSYGLCLCAHDLPFYVPIYMRGVHLYSACASTECVCVFGTFFYMCVPAQWLSIMVVSMLTDLDLCGFPLY